MHMATIPSFSPADSLTIRDRVLQTLIDEEAKRAESTTTRLSSTGNCLRQQAYFLTRGQAQRTNAESIWEARDGDTHEPELRRRFEAAGYHVGGWEDESERLVWLRLPNGQRVPGHFDGEISGMGLPGVGIWEAKAMSAVRFSKVVKSGVRLSNPEYYYQINSYMKARGRLFTVFAAKAKDGSQVRNMIRGLENVSTKLYIELVPFDPDNAEDGIQRHMAVRDAVANGYLPEREYSWPKDWHCGYCAFVRECQPEAVAGLSDEEIKYPRRIAKKG
jgi:hypothetical protein